MGIASTIFGVAKQLGKVIWDGGDLLGNIGGEMIADAIEGAAAYAFKKIKVIGFCKALGKNYKEKLAKLYDNSQDNWYQKIESELLEQENVGAGSMNLGKGLDALFRKFVFVDDIYQYICNKSPTFKDLQSTDKEAAEIFAKLIVESYEGYVNTLFKQLSSSKNEYFVTSVLALLINKQRTEQKAENEDLRNKIDGLRNVFLQANAGKEFIVSDASSYNVKYVTIECPNCHSGDFIDYNKSTHHYKCQRCAHEFVKNADTVSSVTVELKNGITTIVNRIEGKIDVIINERKAELILELTMHFVNIRFKNGYEELHQLGKEELSKVIEKAIKPMLRVTYDVGELPQSLDKKVHNVVTTVLESCLEVCKSSAAEQKESPEQLKKFELLEKDKKAVCEKLFKDEEFDAVAEYIPLSGSSIWASSLVKSYESNGNQGDIEKSLKAFSECGKQTFVVFISAQSKNKEGQPSLEYKVAKRLAEEFEKRRIGYFWWEKAKELRIQAYKDGKENGERSIYNEWPISTKIAAGLAFSSVMVALAFDNVTKDGDDEKYQYDSLLDNADSNGFKYEVAQFSAMTNDQKKAKEFVKGIVDDKNFKSRCPTKRYLKFFTYGEPKNHQKYKNAADESIFDNREDIIVPVQGRNADTLAEEIYKKVSAVIFEDPAISELVNKRHDNAVAKNYFFPLKEQINLPGDNDWKGLSPCPEWNKNDLKVNYPDEDTESVPSDVFFEYAVIDEEGKSAKNHFTFFPERDGKNWKMKILIKDWNYAFIEEPIRKSQKENGTSQKPVPFPQDSLAGFESVTCAMDGAKETAIALKKETQRDAESDYKNFGGGLLTVATTYAGYEQWKYANGTLCFSKEDSKEERRYYFYIRFLPKRVIKYRIRTFGQHVHFKLETRLRKPISVEVVLGRNSSASRLCERYPEKYQISKSLTIDGGAITNNSLKDMAFGLRPVGRDADYFVLLEDGSIDSLQTIDKKVLRCPYCGRPYPCGGEKVPDEEKNRCYYNFTYPYYKGAQDGEKSKQDENASDSARQGISMLFQQVSQDDVEWISHLGNELKRNVKPMKVPEGIKEGAVISLAGVSGSGKSTFLSALFGMLSGTETYISKIFERYVETSIFVNSATQDTENDMAKQMRQNYYAVELYKGFVERTAHGDLGLNAQIAHVPHTIELSNIQGKDGTAYLSIFDVPGGCLCVPQGRSATDTETYEFKNYSKDYTMLCKSDCIILLVNGEAGNGASDAQIDFGSAQGILAELRLKLEESDRNAIALAVVLCKFDMFNTAFDKNSYVRSSPPVSADGKNESQQKFGGSQLHKYIEGCSREVKAFIEEKHGVGLIQEVNCFKHHMYFTVSSTGRSDIIAVKGGEKYMIYRSQPNNVDNVLLWLMYQTGIIR